MQRVVYSLLLVTAVVACSTNDSRYKDISHLEQPPTLPSNPSGESYAVDDSRIERTRASQGLSSTVYLVEDKPLQIRIKMPIDKAWYALAQAIKQSGMKVTDYDRGKKVYYVQYGEAETGLLESFLMESPKVNYILALKEYNKETVIIATLAPEQESDPEDASEKLLRNLYEILHDELKPDYNGS
jgi:uncharacterized lipoprotein